MFSLRTEEKLESRTDAHSLLDISSIECREIVNSAESHQSKIVQMQITKTIAALEKISGTWNKPILSILDERGWEFVSVLLMEMYSALGNRTMRSRIDISSLISSIASSRHLHTYVASYRASGIKYAMEIIEIAVECLVGGLISRIQFVAMVKQSVTSNLTPMISLEETPPSMNESILTNVLADATAYKSRFQSELYCMCGLVAQTLPWIFKTEGYAIFSGKSVKHPIALKRKRDGASMKDMCVNQTPEKRRRVSSSIIPDDYFSDSLPSDDVLSDIVDADREMEIFRIESM